MRTRLHLLGLCSFALFLNSVAFSATVAQEKPLGYITFKVADLDEPTRHAIDEFNKKLALFSKGCSKEHDNASFSLLGRLAADTKCGLAIRTAFTTKRWEAATLAVIVCGIEAPKALRERYEAKEAYATCKETEELLKKYNEYCKDKTLQVFAYKDILYCLSPVDKVTLLEFNLKSNEVRVRRQPSR